MLSAANSLQHINNHVCAAAARANLHVSAVGLMNVDRLFLSISRLQFRKSRVLLTERLQDVRARAYVKSLRSLILAVLYMFLPFIALWGVIL